MAQVGKAKHDKNKMAWSGSAAKVLPLGNRSAFSNHHQDTNTAGEYNTFLYNTT